MDTCSIRVVITRQSNPPISQFKVRVMNSRVSGQCSYTIICLHSVISLCFTQ